MTTDALPSIPTRNSRRSWFGRHRVATIILGTILVVTLSGAGALAWVQWSMQGQIYTVHDAPTRPVAIVFGAGLTAAGTPSPYLKARLDDARQLFADGTVDAILVSGDNRKDSYDEPTAMRDYLTEQGVPPDAIVRDFAGLDTYDTCARAHDIFGVDAAVLVTQDYHLPRALFSCAHSGIDAVGVGSPAIGGPISEYRLRELVASLKAAADAVISPEPTHLGKQETSVQEAVARNAQR